MAREDEWPREGRLDAPWPGSATPTSTYGNPSRSEEVGRGAGRAHAQARKTRRNWPPPGSISLVTERSGARREIRSTSQRAASSPSARVGHRAMTSRPPLRCKRSTLVMIGAGSTTKRWSGHATTGVTAPFLVLHPRCAKRSRPPADRPLLLLVRETTVSTLGPRASLTDISGSTGSSQSQHRQPSTAPTSSSRLNL